MRVTPLLLMLGTVAMAAEVQPPAVPLVGGWEALGGAGGGAGGLLALLVALDRLGVITLKRKASKPTPAVTLDHTTPCAGLKDAARDHASLKEREQERHDETRRRFDALARNQVRIGERIDEAITLLSRSSQR